MTQSWAGKHPIGIEMASRPGPAPQDHEGVRFKVFCSAAGNRVRLSKRRENAQRGRVLLREAILWRHSCVVRPEERAVTDSWTTSRLICLSSRFRFGAAATSMLSSSHLMIIARPKSMAARAEVHG